MLCLKPEVPPRNEVRQSRGGNFSFPNYLINLRARILKSSIEPGRGVGQRAT